MSFKLLTQLFTSNRLKRILRELTKSIVPAVVATHDRHDLVPLVLRDLVRLENRPPHFAEMAYELCSSLCENHQCFENQGSLLLLSLEIGFCHLDPQRWYTSDFQLNHTEHHRGLIDVVFKSGDGEAIADLLHALTMESSHHDPAHTLLGICTEHLADLHNRTPLSSRLRCLVMRSVGLIGYKGFEGVGVERLFQMLNHLRVTAEDIDTKFEWMKFLLDVFQSPEGIRHLSQLYWELLVELAISPWSDDDVVIYNPQIVVSLTEAEAWDKLECWMGTVWMIWPPGVGGTTEEDLERMTLLLFHHQPGVVQKLIHWMERWRSGGSDREVPESFKRICAQAREAAQQDLL